MIVNSVLYLLLSVYLQTIYGVIGLIWAKNVSLAFRGGVSLGLSGVKFDIFYKVLLSRVFMGLVGMGVCGSLLL